VTSAKEAPPPPCLWSRQPARPCGRLRDLRCSVQVVG
jgi:hypothetical protein